MKHMLQSMCYHQYYDSLSIYYDGVCVCVCVCVCTGMICYTFYHKLISTPRMSFFQMFFYYSKQL